MAAARFPSVCVGGVEVATLGAGVSVGAVKLQGPRIGVMRGHHACTSTGRTALSTNAPPPGGHSPSYPAQQPYPYGQPQYGGQPPQYGQPYPGTPAPPPPRRGFFSRFNLKTKIQMIAGVVVVIFCGVWYGLLGHDTPDTGPANTDSNSASAADVGDCLQNKGSESDPDLIIVDCGDTAADYKVKQREVMDYTCDPQYATYQLTRNGRPQFTLCMEHISK